MKNIINKIKSNKNLILLLSLLTVFQLILYALESHIKSEILFGILIPLVTIFYFLYCKKNKLLNHKSYVLYIIILGILIRDYYVFKYSIDFLQHDVESIDESGHLGYIYTIYKTGKLPSTNYWQFYHPPFFHLIGALWLKINHILGISLNKSIEGLQYITCVFSSLSLIISTKIIDKLKINDKNKLYIIIFLAVFPTNIYLSGSINNDCLLTFLEVLIIWLLIKWYEKSSWSNTIMLAITTGLCVMTKLNGATMAIPIMYIFIKKILNNKKDFKNLIIKILVFALMSLPIGLWFQLRELLLFGSNNIPNPGDYVYTGNHTFIERFGISFKYLFSIFCVIPGEYNILSYCIKSSLFGDSFYTSLSALCFIILLSALIIIVNSIISMIKYLINKKEKNIIIDIFIIIWLVNIICFYIFNIKYPYACSMDFRYIILTAYSGIILVGYNLNDKKISKIVQNIILIFSLLSAIYIFIM